MRNSYSTRTTILYNTPNAAGFHIHRRPFGSFIVPRETTPAHCPSSPYPLDSGGWGVAAEGEARKASAPEL